MKNVVENAGPSMSALPSSRPGDAYRIAHVLSSLALGGQERVALDLAASQARSGHDVTVVSLAGEGSLAKEFRAAGVAVKAFVKKPGVQVGLALRLAAWLRGRIDLVHTHNPAALLYGAPAASVARIACVHTKHGANPGTGRRLMANRFAGALVDAFVAVSPETAQVARERNEVPPYKLSVIPNGVDLDRFRPNDDERRQAREALGLAPDAWVVGTVGRVATEKNQALLLRAARSVEAAEVVVIGDGPLLPSLRALAAELGITSRVHLLGARPDVALLLNAFDVFALTSSSEGLPLVVPEAMATGLPVVSTAVGGIPSVVEDGAAGFLVPAGDEAALRTRLEELARDRDLGRRLGAHARESALSRLSATRMRDAYRDLYASVLERRRLAH